jgi:hypothetical protein
MKGLRALVIIMGVMIVAGLIVVIVTIASRLSGSETTAGGAAPPKFDNVDLPVPAGCQVVETVTAADRLVLRLGSGERCNRVLIVDLGTGELLGSLRLVPKAQ